MIDQFILQLQSSDSDKRRQAIIALGKSKDPAALPHLAKIYRNDSEPSLRDLARRAGQHIRQSMNVDSASATGVTSAPRSSAIHLIGGDEPLYADEETQQPVESEPARESAYTGPVRGHQYEVSKENRDRAKSYVEEALSMNMKGDNAKGMKMLAAALSLNPNIVNDSYFMSIAASVTGLEGDGAVQMILDSNQRKSFVKEQEKQKKQARIDKHLGEAKRVSWASTWFEIALFALINAVGPILQTLVLLESARAYFNNLPPEILNTREMQAALAPLNDFNVGALVLTGVFSAVAGVIGLLIQTVIVHYLAVLLLGGHGTLRYMLELLLGFYNKWLPRIFFISYIATAVAFVSEFSPVAICVVIPLILLSLYVMGKTSSKIGEAYDFGAVKGCLAYVISILIVAILSSVLLFAINQAFGMMLQNLIPPL